MKIAASALQLSASHAESSRHEVRERLRTWVGERPDFEAIERGQRGQGPPVVPTVQISDAGKAQLSAEASAISESADAVANDPMLSLLKAMIELLTGRIVETFDAGELTPPATPAPPALRDPNQAAAGNQPSRPSNFGLEYDRHESYSEAETTRFQAEGVVRTADGQEIRFSVDLEMSRSYHEESDISLRLGNARKKDPLVINFAGTAAQLSDQRFRIDLDADGAAEEARFLATGSGFLVFDRNGDGRINDGREMFGAITGDGFAELAALDSDGNGWIDEGDIDFAKMRVWTKAVDGSDHFTDLAASGVGALNLARVATPFDLKDDANASLGEIRSTGVYLKNNGDAGTVQQIDLSV